MCQAQYVIAQPRLVDLLLELTVDGDGVVTLAMSGHLAAAGLQCTATWCVVVKWARLDCLPLWVLQSLCAAVLLQCSITS